MDDPNNTTSPFTDDTDIETAGTNAGNLVTAAQIENGCPERLEALGNRIRAHLEKAGQAERRADNHHTSAGILLAQVKEACTEGGFAAFRERFCPNLGRSRTYELLQIAGGTKSAEEIRAENAERNRRHRAKQKAAELVRHVTDTEPASVALNGAAPSPTLAWAPPVPTPPTTGRRTRAKVRLDQYQHAVWVVCNTVENAAGLVIPPPNLDPETAAADSDLIAGAIKRLRRLKAALDVVAEAGDVKRVAA